MKNLAFSKGQDSSIGAPGSLRQKAKRISD
jgi:hypothetical protein